MSNEIKTYGLCYRCEHRALWNETQNHRPRFECGADISVRSCYMFQPIKPLVLEPNEKDNRPIFGPTMLSARMHSVGFIDMELEVIEVNTGYLLQWVIKNEK